MIHTECRDCKLREGDCGHHFKMDGKTNFDIASLTACDRYGNCMFFTTRGDDQMVIHIRIKGNPSKVTQQQKGETIINGHIHHYEKANVKAAKDALRWQLKPYVPKQPLSGPIFFKAEWRFELKRCNKRAWKTTKSDLDNLEKGLLDVLTDMRFWNDDAQVCMKQTCKKEVPVGEGFLDITITEIRSEKNER